MVRVNKIKLNQVVSKAKSVRKAAKNKPQKLRKSLTPGTIAIALTGQFRGSRVVVLKQLEKSGLLLVTGPFKVNGIPLRRMNARYVIATSTKVDVSGIDTKKFDDAYFKRDDKSGKKGAAAFLDKGKKSELSAAKKADQAAVDAKIVAKLDATMKKYMKSKFALSSGQMAHELKF
ncbi:unnamed protein product [Amoebophrya sp. A120]|nr:unnamed protein product [Amoebophrya sp. A120]|eukprot:GSA120T00011385001.1